MHDQTSIPAKAPTGRNPSPECPGTLELAVGAPWTAYRAITPCDPEYDAFSRAWRLQDQWDDETHRTFWTLGLPAWPCSDGQINRREMRAWWVWSGRRHGLDDREIAARVGLELDTLRRQGCLKMADEFASQPPVPPRTWRRLPLVVAVDLNETVPGQFEGWQHLGLSSYHPDSMRRVLDDFKRIARVGVRVRGS